MSFFPPQKLSFLPFEGKVDIKNCQHMFHILEDYGDDCNTAPLEPMRIFFGRLIGHGQRHLISRYAVRERHFIGSTSMDAQLSFIMANQAKVSCYVRATCFKFCGMNIGLRLSRTSCLDFMTSRFPVNIKKPRTSVSTSVSTP